MRKFLTFILCIAMFVGGFWVCKKIQSFELFTDGDATYDVVTIEEQIDKLSDLTTLKYRRTDTAQFKEDKKKLFDKLDIPFTDKSLLVQYDAVVKLGTDLDNMSVDVNDNTISVELSPCEIRDIYIVEDSWKYLDSKSYIFNPLKPEDDSELHKTAMENVRQKVQEEDLVSVANKNAVEEVETMLSAVYPEAEIEVSVR